MRCVLRARVLIRPSAAQASPQRYRGLARPGQRARESAGRGPRPRRRGSRARATQASACSEQTGGVRSMCSLAMYTLEASAQGAHARRPSRLQRGARGRGTARIMPRSSQLPAHVARCGGVHPAHGVQEERSGSRRVAAQRRVQNVGRVRAGGGGRRAAAGLARQAGGGLCAGGRRERTLQHKWGETGAGRRAAHMRPRGARIARAGTYEARACAARRWCRPGAAAQRLHHGRSSHAANCRG